jgi:hypothetical protein
VDRSKPRLSIVHRHPYGRSNHVRESCQFSPLERWLQGVEEIVFECYLSQQDEQD